MSSRNSRSPTTLLRNRRCSLNSRREHVDQHGRTEASGRLEQDERSRRRALPLRRLPQFLSPSRLPEELSGPRELALVLWNSFWSPASLKGWAGSVTLHGLLLLTLALWYFAPPLRRALRFDSRLAGSPKGVAEGLTLTGGMNTPLAMPELHGTSLESRRR